MKKNRMIVIVLLATIGLATAADPAANEQPQANPAIEGHWEGSIEIPGTPLGVKIDLAFDDGSWNGTIDVPAQAAKGLPLAGVKVSGSNVEFAIASVPGEPTFRGKLTDGEIVGKFTQGGSGFPFKLGREAKAGAARPQEPKPPFPYASETISVANGEITLAGTLTLPAGEGPHPAVLLISGSGQQNRDEEIFEHKPFWVLADHLSRAGIAVLRVDDRGVGESTGDATEATSEHFAEDALAGVKFLLAHDEIDSDRIGLIGHSEGGMIGPMVVAKSDAVSFVVLMAGPGVPGDQLLLRQNSLIMRAQGLPEESISKSKKAQLQLFTAIKSDANEAEIRSLVARLIRAQIGAIGADDSLEDMIEQQTETITSPWMRYFLQYDPRPVLGQVRVPVLAINGEKDLQVDPKQNLPEIGKALEAAGNDDVTLEEVPGMNHLFQQAETGLVNEYYSIEETLNPAVLEMIRDWILERFGGSDS